jgi:hypothetical protein
MFDVIKGNVIHAHLGYNIVVVLKQIVGFASLIKKYLMDQS